jgi:hypothetical protein
MWYKVQNGANLITKKLFLNYLSSYLNYNSLFFQKCVYHLLKYLREIVGVDFNKVCVLSSLLYNLLFLITYGDQVFFNTDRERTYFKSRIFFFFASKLLGILSVYFFACNSNLDSDTFSYRYSCALDFFSL